MFTKTKDISQKRPLLLLGAYGRGNAGDDVFLHCAETLFKDKDIYINSADNSLLPSYFQGRVKTIQTTSWRDVFTKIKLYLALREVVYWGGDLWVELYGTKIPRQQLYKMLVMNSILRLSNKKIYYVGCGIGDLKGFSLWLARSSAKMAEKIVVREQRSATILNLGNVAVLPDLAINLPWNRAKMHTLPAGKPFVITISILQSIPNPAVSFPKLIEQVSTFINSLSLKDFKIVLLPMHVTDAEPLNDLWASKQLIDKVKGHQIEIFEARELEKIVEQLRNSDLVIGTRLHADILAVLNGTPSIGIAYRPKVRSFFKDNRLEEFCLDLDQLERLPAIFAQMYDNYDEVAGRFYQAGKKNLEKQADYKRLAEEI